MGAVLGTEEHSYNLLRSDTAMGISCFLEMTMPQVDTLGKAVWALQGEERVGSAAS